MTSHEAKMPEMPPAAYVGVQRGEYVAHYSADQMRAMYLAGLEAAKTMIGEMQEYKPALQRCRPAKTGYIAFMGKKSATLEGEEYGWINTGTTLTNLTALEQEAKK